MMGPPEALGQKDEVPPPSLIQSNTRGIADLTTVLLQVPQFQIPFQAYAMGPSQVSFFFRFEPPTDFPIYVGSLL